MPVTCPTEGSGNGSRYWWWNEVPSGPHGRRLSAKVRTSLREDRQEGRLQHDLKYGPELFGRSAEGRKAVTRSRSEPPSSGSAEGRSEGRRHHEAREVMEAVSPRPIGGSRGRAHRRRGEPLAHRPRLAGDGEGTKHRHARREIRARAARGRWGPGRAAPRAERRLRLPLGRGAGRRLRQRTRGLRLRPLRHTTTAASSSARESKVRCGELLCLRNAAVQTCRCCVRWPARTHRRAGGHHGRSRPFRA